MRMKDVLRGRQGLAALVMVAGLGCGTLTGGTKQRVTFTSQPEGAEVLLDTVPIGRTPLEVEVRKETFKDHHVIIRADGYQTKQFAMGKTLERIALLNCSSALSWGTDALTGGLIEYDPEAYFVELKPALGVDPAAEAGLSPEQLEELAFVLGSHRRLLSELVRGDGEHVRTLSAVMEVPEERYEELVSALIRELPVLLSQRYPYQLYAAIARVVDDRGLSARVRQPLGPPSLALALP